MEFPVIASEWEVSRVVSNLQINVYVGIYLEIWQFELKSLRVAIQKVQY